MPGVKGRSGGARAGSGRKADQTKVDQQVLRDIFLEVVTPAEWRACIRVLLASAQAGNVAAFRELSPWVVGKVPEEQTLKVSGGVEIYLPERKAES
jgi:hypothetical protein